MFDLYVRALFPALAMDRMNTAQAIGLVIADRPVAEKNWDAATRELYRVEG